MVFYVVHYAHQTC